MLAKNSQAAATMYLLLFMPACQTSSQSLSEACIYVIAGRTAGAHFPKRSGGTCRSPAQGTWMLGFVRQTDVRLITSPTAAESIEINCN